MTRLTQFLLEGPPATSPKSVKTSGFDKCMGALPSQVQELARKTFRQWVANPSSTDFRPLKNDPNVYRISIGYRYRAIAERTGPGTYRWFWIGSHEAYNDKV